MWIVDMWNEACYQFDGIKMREDDGGWGIFALKGDTERRVGYSRQDEKCKKELQNIISKINSDDRVIYVQYIY